MMVFLNKSKSKEILIILPKNIQSLRLHSKPLKTQRFYLPKYLKTPLFFEVKKGKKSSFFRISKLPKSGIYFLTLKAKEQNINGFEKLSLKSLCLERAVHQIKIIKEGFKNQKIHCLPTAVKAKKPIKSIAKEPLKWIFLSGLSFGSLKQSSEKGWDLGIELGLAIEKSWFFTKLSSSYFLPKDHNLEKEFKNLGNQKFQLNRDFLSIDLSVGSHLNIANMKILFGPNLSFIYVLRQNYHQNLVAIEEIPLPDNKFLNAGGLFEASWSFYKDLSLALNLKIGHKMQSLSLLVGKSNP